MTMAAESAFEMSVAIAMPMTPALKTVTAITLSTTLSSIAAASAYSGRRVSPFARSTAEPKLYARKNTLPAK